MKFSGHTSLKSSFNTDLQELSSAVSFLHRFHLARFKPGGGQPDYEAVFEADGEGMVGKDAVLG
jgi:hypothetical protein